MFFSFFSFFFFSLASFLLLSSHLLFCLLVPPLAVLVFPGGGTFVSRSGNVQHFAGGNGGARGGAGARAAIPEEALPSEEMLDRQLEAVTISESEGESCTAVVFGDTRSRVDAGRRMLLGLETPE